LITDGKREGFAELGKRWNTDGLLSDEGLEAILKEHQN
jgi:hypothetical protein|tara:strand:+ start:93 stop:206 length:114 start_codon:yes stop_codon:yes gene_type:complete